LIEELTAPPEGMFPTRKKGKKKRKKLLAALAATVGAGSGAFAAPDGEHRSGEPNGIGVVPDEPDLDADADKKERKKKKKKDR
jgi:hypothetical protein